LNVTKVEEGGTYSVLREARSIVSIEGNKVDLLSEEVSVLCSLLLVTTNEDLGISSVPILLAVLLGSVRRRSLNLG
jgi:hypothetical protein